MESVNNMVASVVRSYHWTPRQIDEMYLDDEDYYGLEYWYNDVMEVSDELKSKSKD